jgi:glutathione synthase
VPPEDEFRSNVHLGAAPRLVPATDDMRRLARFVGPVLQMDGLRLAGMDVIGDKIVEVNVFSTGGIGIAERLSGKPFVDELLARLEAVP